MTRIYQKKELIILFFLCLSFVVIKLALSNYITFFWDAIANLSKPAYFFYNTNFHAIFLPANYVSDPPLLQLYVAFMWKILGRSLATTHIIMTIFPIISMVQLFILCKRLVSNKNFWFIYFMVLLDATFLSQTFLLDNDEVIVAFSLLSINAILSNKRTLLSLYLLGMGLVSIRGMDITLGLFVAYFLIYRRKGKKLYNDFVYALIPFLPVISLFLIYISAKKLLLGYFFISDINPWKEFADFVSFSGLIHNVLALGFAFIDYGRIFIWLLAFVLLWKYGHKKFFTSKLQSIWIIWISILGSMLFITLPIQNPIGERYFILHFLLFSLLIGIIMFENIKDQKAKIASFFIILALLSGNFWLYPEKKAQAWDASLVYIPYFSLRQQVIKYCEKEHIDLNTVGFGFPNTADLKYIDVNEDNRYFSDLDFKRNQYIIFSHFPNWDTQLDSIKHTKLLKTYRSLGLSMSIYKNTYYVNQ
ncbi:hypothetical protein [Microbacter margulisiae]|uniref:Dolichyl-phosphate-mannose-protein mannosyltransferase n=1 Tax=Microbacter margulisiae TaxID=1350067 RepID=A0A7W5H0I4_9PORP|nr:hypothetical protein [Microbacter margulisiae]MBB3186603.1 hypothetical protein [Microbacter margulisiae]